jgi:hypothetical protein
MQQQQAKPVPTNDRSIEIVSTGGGVGAEICGLDLRRLDEQNFRLVHRAWIDHQVGLIAPFVNTTEGC